MKNNEDRTRNINGWAICAYDGKNNARGRSCHPEGSRNNARNTVEIHNINLINVLAYLSKVLFSFCFCAVDLFIDFVTNKWLWNVLYVIINVALDIFFHLVLALAAVMIVLILNIDDLYQQAKDENLNDIDTTSDDEQMLDILEKETCPELV